MASQVTKVIQVSKILLIFHLIWIVHCATAGGGLPTLPYFLAPVTNYTAAVGKTADLTCKVDNLTKYKVAWFHMDRKMLLTIHKMVVTRIPRFSVVQDDSSTWTLHIDDVTREDRGQYMCQVNTEPMLSQVGYLDVVVPPVILDDLSSGSSVVVQENGNVTLTCHAEGNPQPRISWVREDQRHITLSKRRKVIKLEESTLGLSKVSRRDMGAYLCIASNGVPPSVSKRIELKVQFSPIVLLPNQLMSAPRGSMVWLECKTEAYPKAVTFWKHNGTMIMSTNKYTLEEFHHDDYTTTVKLTIKQLGPGDFGKYLCYSRNSFGENDGTVELHELKREPPRAKSDRDSEEVNTMDHFPLHREGGRGENQLLLDREGGSAGGSTGGSAGSLGGGSAGISAQSEVGMSAGAGHKGGTVPRNTGPADIFNTFISGNAGPGVGCQSSAVLLLSLSSLSTLSTLSR